jgi:hypothetical protein
MIAIGAGEILGSIFNGELHDRLGTKTFIYINLVE